MIVARIAGGLGNQLFQYAAARRLAQHKRVEFALDISFYAQQPRRAYRLEYFNIQGRLAFPFEVLRAQDRIKQTLVHRIWRQRWKLLPYYRRRVIREQLTIPFDPRLLQMPSEAYLIGYWGNEKYFAPIASTIRAEFTLKQPLSARSAALAAEIERSEAIGVHVRRGDYAHDPATNHYHGLCSPEYYHTCARQLLAQHPRAVFYVFSDEPEWVSSHLDLGPATVIVDHNGPERDYEDLHLLSLCRHFIIANSTFSWWGAWLSTQPGKSVYAPQRWHASGGLAAADIVPAEWQLV